VTETSSDGGLAAREAALSAIDAALAKRAGLDEGVASLTGLEPRDRAFARMLTMTVLRRLGQLDVILAARLHRPPPESVKSLLRLGLAQALFMDTPDHAAVATTLSLAERRKETRAFKGLINAILRGTLREPPKLDPVALAPDWLFARWRAAYGEAEAANIAAAIGEEPPTDLSLRADADAAALAEQLEAEILPGGSLRTSRGGDVAGWPGYEEGQWWVQDAAAAVPGRLLAVQAGETVLDLCAAPGGKTLQLAAAGARVVAVDRSASRLKRLSANLARTRLEAEVVAADATEWTDARTFDAVLLDAPCSATGTFRRQPDVLWQVKPADIARLSQVQSALLEAAAVRVRPGGRLVYSVCSLEPEEGEAQARAFLKRHPDFTSVACRPGEGGAPQASLTDAGTLRILPHHRAGGLDGFFIARFARGD
jgi:16S rRNA (cytosine967-C5)-methyltransferase